MFKKITAEWGEKNLVAVGLVFLVGMLILAVANRWTALPNLAEQVPAEETEAFVTLSAEATQFAPFKNVEAVSTWAGKPIAEWPWIRSVGTVWRGVFTLSALEVSSRAQAEKALESLKVKDEKWVETPTESGEVLRCYEWTQPLCWVWSGGLLWTSSEAQALEPIVDTAHGKLPNIESDTVYQNVRGRLASWPSAFVYINLSRSKHRFLSEAAAWSSLTPIFPAMGASFKLESGATKAAPTSAPHFLIESFLAVDKAKLGGAYDHPTQNFTAQLFKTVAKPLAVEWSGTDLAGQVTAMQSILQKLSPATALAWTSELNRFIQKLTANSLTWDQLAPFLQHEVYLSWTPQDPSAVGRIPNALARASNAAAPSPRALQAIALLTLDEKTLPQVEEIWQKTLTKAQWWSPFALSSGELRAEPQALHEEIQNYRGVELHALLPTEAPNLENPQSLNSNQAPILVMATTGNTLLLSTDLTILKSTLDNILDAKITRPLEEIRDLFTGADEALILHCLDTPKSAILEPLLRGIETVNLTRKRFDDGVFTRAFLQLTHD